MKLQKKIIEFFWVEKQKKIEITKGIEITKRKRKLNFLKSQLCLLICRGLNAKKVEIINVCNF